MTSPLFQITNSGIRVVVKVTPKSRQDQIRGIGKDSSGLPLLLLTVRVLPEDGQANEAVIRLLAEAWNLPKRGLSIQSGQTSRTKSILVQAGNEPSLLKRLVAWAETIKS